MILLFVLGTVSGLAAIALSSRFTEGRAERIVASVVVWGALVTLPTYLLGLANALTRTTVLASTVLGSLAAFGVGLRPYGRPALERFRGELVELASLPGDAFAIVWRANALFVIPLALALAYFVWLLVAAFYQPCWGDWDALWYHEPMIGYSIQNGGFRPVPLPPQLQVINGYTRLAEVTQTWFALWGGRRVVDVTNFAFVPAFVAAMYGLVHLFTRDRAVAVAWGSVVFLQPMIARLTRCTMVDVQGSCLLFAALYWMCHPRLTRARCVLFATATTLAVGIKTIYIATAGLACVLVLVRMILARRELGPRWVLAIAAGGGGAALAMIASTHLRSYYHFGNPLWPVALDIPRFGVHLPGVLPFTGSIEANIPRDVLVRKLLARPFTILEGHTWYVDDYGYAYSWCVLPAALVACVLAPTTWLVRTARARLRGAPPDAATKLAGLAALLSVVTIGAHWTSPGIYQPRYTLAPLAAAVVVVCWMFRVPRLRRGLHAVVFLVQVAAVTMTYWVIEPRPWVLSPSEMRDLLRTPYPEREMAKRFRAPVHEATGIAREREIGPGDVVAFDASMLWPALAWNNDFSNRVEYLDDSADPLGQASRLGAKWVYTRGGTALYRQLTAKDSGWSIVGPLENEQFGIVYRRKLSDGERR